MVGAFAEFERAMLRERTKAGLEAARREGRVGGRRFKLTHQQQSEIRPMILKGNKTAADAARLFKVHPATVLRLLARFCSENSGRDGSITPFVHPTERRRSRFSCAWVRPGRMVDCRETGFLSKPRKGRSENSQG